MPEAARNLFKGTVIAMRPGRKVEPRNLALFGRVGMLQMKRDGRLLVSARRSQPAARLAGVL